MSQATTGQQRRPLKLSEAEVTRLVDEAILLRCRVIRSEGGQFESPNEQRCREIFNALKPYIDSNTMIVEEPYEERYIDLDRDGLHWFARVKNEPGKWADVRVEDREVETFPSSEFYDRLKEALGEGLIIVRRNKVIQVYYDERPGGTIMWIEEYPPPY